MSESDITFKSRLLLIDIQYNCITVV